MFVFMSDSYNETIRHFQIIKYRPHDEIMRYCLGENEIFEVDFLDDKKTKYFELMRCFLDVY